VLDHVAPLVVAGIARASAERHRADRAVEFRDRHHHRGLDRQQAARIALPLLERLELDRMRRDVRHVEFRQQRLGSVRVVVRRAADQTEAGERDHCVHRCRTVVHEVAAHRLALVEPAGERRHRLQSLRFECRDHAVVVRGVAGQCVGSHQQHADPGTTTRR